MNYHQNFTNTDFHRSWLNESPIVNPVGVGGYGDLLGTLNSWLEREYYPVETHGKNYRSVTGSQISFWWWEESDGSKPLIVEFEKSADCYSVKSLGKDSTKKKRPPWASDLYLYVARHIKPVRLQSDEKLSDEGMNVWKRLLASNAHIVAYDITTKNSTVDIESEDDLQKFWSLNKDHASWRFAIVESAFQMTEFKTQYGKFRLDGLLN